MSVRSKNSRLQKQFSENLMYQKISEELSNENIYVISSISCTSYSVSLDDMNPPHLDFRVLQLGSRIDDDVTKVQEFLDYYGTHFLTDIIFGAKYLFYYKVPLKTYQQIAGKGIDIRTSASYLSLMNLGAGFKLTSDQKALAIALSQVESNVFSLGLPPPNDGDALTWALAIKEHPVPIRYGLQNIADLFTDKFMVGISGFDYNKVRERIQRGTK